MNFYGGSDGGQYYPLNEKKENVGYTDGSPFVINKDIKK